MKTSDTRIEVHGGISIDREAGEKRCSCKSKADYRIIADDGQYVSFYYHCFQCLPSRYQRAATLLNAT